MNAFESIALRGLLSFGWEEERLDLRPLNLLIGPNGAGKSNLIDAFSLLSALPRSFPELIRQRGGSGEWIHKGAGGDGVASIELALSVDRMAPRPLRYRAELTVEEGRIGLLSESLQTCEQPPLILLEVFERSGAIRAFEPDGDEQDAGYGPSRLRALADLDRTESVMAKLRDPQSYPQLTRLAEIFSGISVYQRWLFGPQAPVRTPQPADLPNRYLLPDASNLGLVLKRLQRNGKVRAALAEQLRHLYEQAADIDILVEGGSVQVLVQERGLSTATPASRLSDGTLRWLALLSILLDPQPPPLICIEEPELGLHPDLIHALGQLLRDAAERTQLIVTTHSDALVAEFSDTPEDVVICERRESGTRLRRLEREPLAHWLERYSLGHAWRSGELGGNRW